MDMELKQGKLHVGAEPSASEMATAAKAARKNDGGGPSEISQNDIGQAVKELNNGHENGELEFFEKDGVVHVRPTEKLLSKDLR